MTNHELIVPALIRNQNNLNTYYGITLTKDILDHIQIRIDQQSPENPKGYQRPVNYRRVKSISEYINSPKSLIPTNLILSCRETNKYIQIKPSGHINISYLHIKKGTIFYIMDGSHRIAGFSEAMKMRAEGTGIRDYLLNAPYDYACEIVFLDQDGERYNFQVINDTHRSTDSGIKRRNKELIIQSTPMDDRSTLPTVLTHGRGWSIFSNKVAESLNSRNFTRDNIFLNRIQMPGETKKPNHIVRYSIMATAIHDIECHMRGDGALPGKLDDFCRLYISYWRAITHCIPVLDNLKEFTLFNGTSIEALTNLLPNIIADFDIRSNGLPDPSEMEDLIAAYHRDILDPDFWRRETGRGSGYHGRTGKAALIRYLSGAETGVVI